MAPKKSQHTSEELESIVEKQKKIIENILRIKKAFQDRTISYNPVEIECRLDIVNSYVAKAMKLQDEIDIMDPLNETREELENVCVSTKSLFVGLINKQKKNSAPDTSLSYSSSHHSNLPKMKLPKFSGKYSEYKHFISLFDNLVHNDTSLSEIEKFNHLISCLSDEALGTVKAFQITEMNYPKALESLKRVYDNKCLIFFDTISQLFELPEISRPSASALRSTIDNVSALYDSLKSLGNDKSIIDAIVIHFVMSRIDSESRIKYEEQLDYGKLPLWSDCQTALNRRFQQMSAEEASKSKHGANRSQSERPHKKPLRTSFTCSKPNQQPLPCLYCKVQGHYVTACQSFTALPVNARFDFAKSNQMCINCLRKGHGVSNCKSIKCRVCNKSHHTLLHIYHANNGDYATKASTDNSLLHFERPSTSKASVNFASAQDQVILATAVIKVKDNSGTYHLARALLDSGSQINFMSEDLAQKLRIRKDERPINICTLNSANSSVKHRIHTTCQSRVNSYQFSSDFWILRSISSFHPDHSLPHKQWDIPANIELADPYFYKPQRVDILLGAELFFELLCVGQIKINQSLPALQKTLLGWIVSGKYQQSAISLKASILPDIVENPVSLDILVQRFWELEQVPEETNRTMFTLEQKNCEEFFLKSIRRLSTGRFEVKLPFKGEVHSLGNSYETAKRRFLSLERKISKDSQLATMYMEFMREYRDLGHMTLALNNISHPHYFIPHQCVLRPESSSTKLRVVFDASSKTSSAISLNDILMVGPTIQSNLFSILLKFRLHQYAITADVKKMYRQVQIDEADRNYQLILWRENTEEPIQIYKLNTVTYGTASAPFLATRCLLHLSNLHSQSHPLGAAVLKNDFYVDDMLTGANDIEELENIKSQVSDILSSAGFELAKWFSNHPRFLTSVRQEKSLQFNNSDSIKALGMQWTPKDDSFTFHLDEGFHNLRATKRNILSVSARLFDPLGLLCPLVTKAKILLQEIWVQKLNWDESIPMSLDTSWNKFKNNLSQLDLLSIPRFVCTHPNAQLQIHGFADASMRAYGCCLYVRSQTTNGTSVRLLTAKSKVAPLKTKSLPRLELSAAHLLAKLWNQVKPLFERFGIESVTFWTDSEITLYWIKTHPHTLATFVANRVAEIQELSCDVTWLHVPTKQNPADIASRGCDIDELNSSIWFRGPEFLLKNSTYWPKNNNFTLSPELETLEVKKSVTLLTINERASNNLMDLIEKHSSYMKLIRIFSFLYRFKHFAISDEERVAGLTPTASEHNLAFLKIIEIVQGQEYAPEIEKLRKSLPLQPSLQKLSPFIQTYNTVNRSFSLIRVGGRLQNAPLNYETKFPLLMPKGSHFVMIFLRYLHIQNCHAGAKAMVALLRQKVWVVNAREECAKIVRKCVHCYRYKPKLLTQIMGNLPADRLHSIRPFLISGIDFFGPVYTTLKIRGRPPVKMYIAVFICFTSKAVHLELVADLSTNCFVSVLKRFVARRGVPNRIYCDNATNFVGANNLLRDLHQEFNVQLEKLMLFASERGIEFAFIPPRAPHFGGLWEAAVKSAKHHLLRSIGNALLTADELHTMLAEVEAVLNSRPITAMSSDPNDGEALTPAHLLVGSPLRTLPQGFGPAVPDNKLPYLKRFQLLSELRLRFWRAWSKDYLLDLQVRSKWHQDQPNLAVGTLVLIHEDNLPPQKWLLGRIVAVTTGSDGKVRVAEIKTNTGVLKRPIHKLAKLPVV